MARYFFDVVHGNREQVNHCVGVELSGALEAERELLRLAELLRPQFRQPDTRVSVRNVDGQLIAEKIINAAK
jgi:hypothetical protein